MGSKERSTEGASLFSRSFPPYRRRWTDGHWVTGEKFIHGDGRWAVGGSFIGSSTANPCSSYAEVSKHVFRRTEDQICNIACDSGIKAGRRRVCVEMDSITRVQRPNSSLGLGSRSRYLVPPTPHPTYPTPLPPPLSRGIHFLFRHSDHSVNLKFQALAQRLEHLTVARA